VAQLVYGRGRVSAPACEGAEEIDEEAGEAAGDRSSGSVKEEGGGGGCRCKRLLPRLSGRDRGAAVGGLFHRVVHGEGAGLYLASNHSS